MGQVGLLVMVDCGGVSWLVDHGWGGWVVVGGTGGHIFREIRNGEAVGVVVFVYNFSK